MSNLVFVTVGTSALYNTEIGRVPRRDDARPNNRSLVETMGEYRRKDGQQQLDFENARGVFGMLVDEHTRYWSMCSDYTHNKRNFHQTSAELISTHLMLAELPAPPDLIVLISSDTEEGWLATRVNEKVMEKACPCIRVKAERIPRLDLEFLDVTRAIYELVENKYATTADHSVWFNVTGGFKGVIPSITCLAQPGGWRLYYQHEQLNLPVWLRFDQGGLRSAPSLVDLGR